MQLSKTLCQKDFMDVMKSQWAQFAFLVSITHFCLQSLTSVQRQNMITFNKLVTESQRKKYDSQDLDELEDKVDDATHNNNQGNGAVDKEKDQEWEEHKYWDFIDRLLDEMCDEVKNQLMMELHRMEWEK